MLVVGIHTHPLSTVSEYINFLSVNVFARIAVPYFFMVTGYFLLPQYIGNGRRDTGPLVNNIKKAGLLYAAASMLYIPIGIYAGCYSQGATVATIARKIVFDGTFYHLWYLPASIIGVLLLYLLGRKFSLRSVLCITAALYFAGLLGDSYYGLAQGIPFIGPALDAGFMVFSYTRNGIFYAPVFLAMGAWIAKTERRPDMKVSVAGFAASMSIMLAEGSILRISGFQRHDSMYIALLPCMFFLFQFLLSRKGKKINLLRDVSMWVYILHPLFIIAIRGVAKVTGRTSLLVENSVVHYLAVCLLSFSFAILIARLKQRRKCSAEIVPVTYTP